jgi:hypothetical protein
MRYRFALLIPLLAAGTLFAQEDAQPRAKWDSEHYFAIYLNQERAGYIARRERKLDDGGHRTEEEMLLDLARGQQRVSVTIISRSVESDDGKLTHYEREQWLGLVPVITRMEIKGDQADVVSIQGNRKLPSRQPFNPKVRSTRWIRERMAKQLDAKGDSIEAVVFDPQLPGDGSSTSKYIHAGEEVIDLFGRRVRTTRVIEENPSFPAKATLWMDEDFRTVVFESAIAPRAKIRAVACPEQFALKATEPADVLINSLVDVEGPLKDPENIESLRLTVRFKQPLEEPLKLPQSDRQRTVETTREQLILELSRPAYPADPDEAAPLPDEIRPYLQATHLYNTEDPAIRKASVDAVGERTDLIARGRAIRDWVDNRLKFKSMQVGQATASEVLRRRVGDCTEHSVLVVALARSNGIPARTVDGLVFVPRWGDRENVLGGHQWVQLYIHGRWIDFDAAISGDPAGAFRIATGYGSPDARQSPAAVKAIFSLYGNVVSARVSEVKRKER